jgi:hypothetical protein
MGGCTAVSRISYDPSRVTNPFDRRSRLESRTKDGDSPVVEIVRTRSTVRK